MSIEPPLKDDRDRDFNLLHEYIRGAMYRGGEERDAAIRGYVLAFASVIVYVAGIMVLAAMCECVGINFGTLTAAMARDFPLALAGLYIVLYFAALAITIFFFRSWHRR